MKTVSSMKEVHELANTASGDFSFVFVSEPYTIYLRGRYCTSPEAYFAL